ncbi:MAG: TSUP family transporter [Proteobacteria bacterium]|nr:TSUP family transporter [Pseudomonadota bacterium]
MQLTYEIGLLLFFSGVFAGFIDSIAGGGGLISLPVLLSLGINPQVALGTNKLQATFGVCTAAINFTRKGNVILKECGLGILTTFIGAVTGSFIIQQLDPQFLGRLVPFLLLFVFLYMAFSRKLGYVDRKAKINTSVYYIIFGVLLGFYDGFFGPGTGMFWAASLLFFLGHTFTKAVGVTKIMNFTSNLVALSVFTLSGNVDIRIGVIMAVGQVIGANSGSRMAIRKGAGFIRPVFLFIVLVTIAQLFYRNFLR